MADTPAQPGALHNVYRPSLALLTDLYELTMAYGYWKAGRTDDHAAFHLTFRRHPFHGGYTVSAGLEGVLDFLEHFGFAEEDLAYLATLRGSDGGALFEGGFLEYLRGLRLSVEVWAVPEGTVVFPHEPMVRVTGPILEAQVLETPLLTLMNFPTLIATKAARVCGAARGGAVLEFGLRRAQGIDGGLTAARSAFIGGCPATSNVLAGRLLGIPVKGTHAHSWVMSFDDELTAFEAYAQAMPNNTVLLVDTYDTIEGVKHAAAVGRRLRERGHTLEGVRLDSGDLAYLSQQARKILDDAGLHDTKILASNDLDEHLIDDLHAQGAKIDTWGVGTHLVTAYDDPALGGVYKLSALRRAGDPRWTPKIKLSEQSAKTSVPGVLQVRRYRRDHHPSHHRDHHPGTLLADMIYDTSGAAPSDLPGETSGGGGVIVDPSDPNRRRTIGPRARHEDLLVPVFRDGRRVYDSPPLIDMQRRAKDQLASLHPAIRRLVNPHGYPAGLERNLHDLRTRLIREARGDGDGDDGA